MKRGFDLVLSLAGLLVLLPLLLILWTAIVFGTGRPGFFCQTRVGRKGRDFLLYKFRTMTIQRGAEEGSFEAGSVARVTPIGRVLRRTKLDELPQLWNVFRGDMALVGPRPEVRKWVEAYPDQWVPVLAVRPGITDPASIEFRNEEATLAASADPEATYANEILPRKLALYEDYIREQSLWLDLKILLQTFLTVIKG